ncbi:hypothetical protein TSUD_276410 [Trifolium subterraneum]|uniref:Uncharacterized protein n=1 Tax=Trifolium subterraneum TaxID=3900 RepID=A0A2Z6N7G8_TRISU|nr:hypothetical protein TSUD_276410 [Trifolium subterraneum]
MAASNIASTGIVLEVVTKDNYLDWSVLVKNYLIGKDLWDGIVHVDVDAGVNEIVMHLVRMGALLTEEDWEGYTPFSLAAKSTDDIKIVDWMLQQGGNDLLTMRIKAHGHIIGDIPVLLAAQNGHKEMTTFLYSKTPWFLLLDNQCYYAAKLFSHCIHVEIFGKC